jgi:dipeptidyl aminopeptidase/acylaminoacyl peptidase
MKRTLLLCLLLLLLTACGQATVPEASDVYGPMAPSVVPEGKATATMMPEPIAGSESPTSTPEPTATAAEPTSTPTPEAVEPTQTPTPTTEVTAAPSVAAAAPAAEAASTTGLQGRFVFQVASGGDIYTVNADGSDLTRLTTGMDPDWSPDGSQVTFSRWSQPWGIYAINADGSGEKLVFSSNVARAPVWSPDGTQIAFYFQTEGMTAPNQMCMGGDCRTMPGHEQTEWHVGVVDVADGYLHQPYVDRFSFSPTWSADGGWLVYDGGDSGALPTENHGLCLTTVEGPNNTVLTNDTNDHYPVWSPDGTRIAFMHWKHDHWEIFVMNADGSDRHPLTSSSNYVRPVPNNVSPAWSPDGKQIVFLSDRGGKWEFYVMDADGSNQRQILQNVTDTLDIQYTANYERVISWAQ